MMSTAIPPQDRDAADQLWAHYRGKTDLGAPRFSVGRLHWLGLALLTALAAALLLVLVPTGPLVYALAAAAAGAIAYALRRTFHRPRTPQATSPVVVLYTPPVDPVEVSLEARLLELCSQDRHLLARLVDHERHRHPASHRVQWLRLAITHLERDKS